ncbi:hypothetical protein DERF_003279 [Dermatophagoides farinae]|uniref:Uncharacterized protein n=1 Tax=Dermatophagoides farinae TaxID=6954 RepID=A0A922LCG6_DERFA|nr:hypothetical protein DERF_003279 [Dermatophagoides farinae]
MSKLISITFALKKNLWIVNEHFFKNMFTHSSFMKIWLSKSILSLYRHYDDNHVDHHSLFKI